MLVNHELLSLSQCWDRLYEQYMETKDNNVKHQMDLVQKELNQMAGRRYAEYLREENRPVIDIRA